MSHQDRVSRESQKYKAIKKEIKARAKKEADAAYTVAYYRVYNAEMRIARQNYHEAISGSSSDLSRVTVAAPTPHPTNTVEAKDFRGMSREELLGTMVEDEDEEYDPNYN